MSQVISDDKIVTIYEDSLAKLKTEGQAKFLLKTNGNMIDLLGIGCLKYNPESIRLLVLSHAY